MSVGLLKVQSTIGGHRELAEWLIDVKGATDIEWGLEGAFVGGHRELAEWLKTKQNAI